MGFSTLPPSLEVACPPTPSLHPAQEPEGAVQILPIGAFCHRKACRMSAVISRVIVRMQPVDESMKSQIHFHR